MTELDFQSYADITAHHEYVENKLTSLKKYVNNLDVVTAWVVQLRSKHDASRDLPQVERDKIAEDIKVQCHKA